MAGGDPVVLTEPGNCRFPIAWDKQLRMEVLAELLRACGIECADGDGCPWVWGRIPIMLVPMDDGIAFVAIKDFCQGVSVAEQQWFALRLNLTQSEVTYYCLADQLVIEAMIKCQGLPPLSSLITGISRFEQACVLADGPVIEGLLRNG